MDRLRTLVGASIRQARARRSWTQAQLAEAIGRSTDLISRIERGDSAPSFESLDAISTALNVDPAELFGASPERTSSHPVLKQIQRFSPEKLHWLQKLLEVVDSKPPT